MFHCIVSPPQALIHRDWLPFILELKGNREPSEAPAVGHSVHQANAGVDSQDGAFSMPWLTLLTQAALSTDEDLIQGP